MDLKEAKPFKTYHEQIERLRCRGLIIQDENFAIHVLKYLSYYDLINGYKDILMPNDHFIDGVNIEYLYQLYLLDKQFQSLSVKYSLIIENMFKTILAYILSEDFGITITEYLNTNHYHDSASGLSFELDIKNKVERIINDSKLRNPSKHYKEKYNDIPPWILFKNLHFSTLTNFIKFLKRSQKERLVNEVLQTAELAYFDKVKFVVPALEIIRKFRNSAAHNLNFVMYRVNNRMYSPRIYSLLAPDLLKKTQDNKIFKMDRNALQGFYNFILSVLILLPSTALKSNFIDDFRLCVYNPYNKIDSNKRLKTFEDYISLTRLPKDILKRLNDYQLTINAQL